MNAPEMLKAMHELLDEENNVTYEGMESPEQIDQWILSTCGYCAVGCRLYLGIRNSQIVSVRGDKNSPVNKGRLCLKGRYQWKALTVERATVPMVRRNREMVKVSWDEALDIVTEKMREVLLNEGPEGLAIYSSGLLPLEEQYAIGKLARGYIGTPNLDANTRLCMSSTVSGFIRSFGQDGPPGCYEDLDIADFLLLFGCNPAEMHPNLWFRIFRNKERRGAYLITVDPRATVTARQSNAHLAILPGSNVAFLKGLTHILIREKWIDEGFIAEHTEGFDKLAESVQECTPEVTSQKTGLSTIEIMDCAKRFAQSAAVTTIFAQGVNQSNQSTEVVNLICNLHLITGKIGKPGSTPLSLTGQVGAMSNREVGGGGSLVGYRRWDNPEHRKEVAQLWNIPVERLPQFSKSILQIFKDIELGKVKLFWNIATNPAVSLPHQEWTRKQLDKVFCIVQDVYYPMETGTYADVFLPAAQWGEKTGTFTNSERRVSLARKALDPPGDAKTDLWIIQEIAKRLGFDDGFNWSGPEAVFEEWKRLSRGCPVNMSGMNYQRLESEQGIQWPCPDLGHPGTSRLYEDGVFPRKSGRALLWAIEEESLDCPEHPRNPESRVKYPFILNTGRIREQFHSRTKTKRIAELNLLSSEGFVEISERDAIKLEIRSGDWVRIITENGWIRVRAKVTSDIAQGSIFVPFHFGDLDPKERHLKQAANHLTSFKVDPISMQPRYKLEYCRIEKDGEL